MKENKLRLSIVICTYNRAELLQSCLMSLIRQTADPSLFEIIVVNNNSTDNTQEIVETFSTRHSNIIGVVEFQQGLSHARNRGFRQARTDWVAFLDDDARARPDYVDRLLHDIKHCDFDALGGVYMPWYKYGKPKWFKDRYGSNKANRIHMDKIADCSHVSGGNCAFKKTVLEEMSGFAGNLGMKGNKLSYGEETLLQIQMRREGKRIGFDHQLVVDHAVMPDKMKVAWFFASAFIHGRDYWQIFDLKPRAINVFRAAASMIGPLVFYLPSYLFRLFQADYYFQNFCIDLLSPSMHAAGKIIGAVTKK